MRVPEERKRTLKKAATTAGWWLARLLCAPCIFYLRRRDATRGRCGGVFEAIPLADPHPLPTDRIDIHLRQSKIKAQPENCLLLSLPPELRQLIFETALGRRVLAMDLFPDWEEGRYAVGVDSANRDLPVALLRTCRQVYTEALPVMHQRNTFQFDLWSFRAVVLGGLGLYSLSNIRSVRVRVDYGGEEQWRAMCRLLEGAGLADLTLDFQYRPGDIILEDMNSEWWRSLLRIRGLRTFVLRWEYPPPGGVVVPDADPAGSARDRLHERRLRALARIFGDEVKVARAMEELHALMVGPDADERYRSFLEARSGREEEKAVLEVEAD
ncbi:hypothetical protein C8J57DRAFT_1336082 [Mycena rebaudengoi]|nr:hypothetical protein C8J57DRAFT_1336082 [Mycena rebaudengoi]